MKNILSILFYLIVVFYLIVIDDIVASSSCKDVEIICTAGGYPSEITWKIKKQDNTILISGGGGETKSACLPYGTLTLVGKDSYGDGWNGATIKVIGDDGHVYFEEWSGPTSAQGKIAIKMRFM